MNPMSRTWAKAGSGVFPVLSTNPLQSPIENISSTVGTRSHSSMPILCIRNFKNLLHGKTVIYSYS